MDPNHLLYAVMFRGTAAGDFAPKIYVKYLPWHLLLRHRETCEFAAWVVKLTGVHMEPVLFL